MKNRKYFTIGDIHGSYKALLQVIERSGADIENDVFIVLGDVTDGWPETAESIEFLLSIKNLIYIVGNHDLWVLEYLKSNDLINKNNWIRQGGQATIDSYNKHPELIDKHLKFLEDALPYYEDDKNRLFIHGGYDTSYSIHDQYKENIAWDRTFWRFTRDGRNLNIKYDEVYIGHTPTINNPKNDGSHKRPVNYGKVWNMDTGATYTGMLSIMDIDTKEVWQSDVVMDLYPDHKGRN